MWNFRNTNRIEALYSTCQRVRGHPCVDRKSTGIFPNMRPCCSVCLKWTVCVYEWITGWIRISRVTSLCLTESSALCVRGKKKRSTEICRDNEGCCGGSLTSNNSETGQTAGTDVLKLPGSRDKRLKQHTSHVISLGCWDSRPEGQNRSLMLTWEKNLFIWFYYGFSLQSPACLWVDIV